MRQRMLLCYFSNSILFLAIILLFMKAAFRELGLVVQKLPMEFIKPTLNNHRPIQAAILASLYQSVRSLCLNHPHSYSFRKTVGQRGARYLCLYQPRLPDCRQYGRQRRDEND